VVLDHVRVARATRLEKDSLLQILGGLGEVGWAAQVAAAWLLCVDNFAGFQSGEGFNGFPGLLFGEPEIIKTLQIEPKPDAGAEEMSEAQSRVARNRARTMQNLRDTIGRHASFRASSAAPISSASSSSARCSPG